MSLGQQHWKGHETCFHVLLVLTYSVVFFLSLFLCLLLFHLQVFSSTFIFKQKPTSFPFEVLESCSVTRTYLLPSIVLCICTLSIVGLRHVSFFWIGKLFILKDGIMHLSWILWKVNVEWNHTDDKFFSFLREQEY